MDADLEALAAAQQAVLTEASSGGFGDPAGAHWDASEVLAHLLVNESVITAVTQALVRGDTVDYDNAPSQDAFVLRRTILDAGDRAGLVSALGEAFDAGRLALHELDSGGRATAVHVRIWHEGERIVDTPHPWWAFAVQASAARHLPAHLEQLRDLRRSEPSAR